jgi:hypothetical protein
MAKPFVLAVLGVVVAASGWAAPRVGRAAETQWAVVAQKAKTRLPVSMRLEAPACDVRPDT